MQKNDYAPSIGGSEDYLEDSTSLGLNKREKKKLKEVKQKYISISVRFVATY